MANLQIILSTGNSSKAEQIKPIFAGLPIEVLTLKEVGILGRAQEIDGSSMEINSRIKARFAWEQLKHKTWTMADDTGLKIRALGGRPGVDAATWAGKDASLEEIMNFTLEQMKRQTDRTAEWETCAVLISPEGDEYIFKGACPGKLLEAPRCKPQKDMPYSAIFVPDGYDEVWAQMPVEKENTISHRGKAFGQVRQFLIEHLNLTEKASP